jgi:hypothetical protein
MFVTYSYTLELVLLLYRELSLKRAFSLLQTLLFVIYLLANTNQKSKNFIITFPVELANQYLQILMGSTTFLIEMYYN